MSKTKIVFSNDFEDTLKKAALESIEQNGIDVTCPKCNNKIHLSFSGDTCKFCGLVINYGTEPND